MNKLAKLFRLKGTIDRRRYGFIGTLLFFAKYNLDRIVAHVCFGRSWWITDYLLPRHARQISAWTKGDLQFYGTLLMLAVPFIWIGVALTVQRLRSLRLPVWEVILFFVPFVNLIFFVILSLLPSRSEELPRITTASSRSFLDRLIPESRTGSAVTAILLTAVLGVILTMLSASVLRNYGWGLFVGLPFCMGLFSAVLYGYHRPRSMVECQMVSMAALILAGGSLLSFAVEGILCLVMAFPIAALLALMGASVGYIFQERRWRRGEAPIIILILIFGAPFLMGAESHLGLEAPEFAVRSSVEINAPPAIVWKNVVAFSELPPPTEWLFKIGIAYPIRAKIRGSGVGAVRRCIFSTGPFVEPITVWDAPRLLRFAVAANPPPMQEWTPYRHIDPPHLHGFLVSHQGQFLLIPLPNGRTKLEGTTWYSHHMWPAPYWTLWSDCIIHKIHLRVLRQIKSLSEHGK